MRARKKYKFQGGIQRINNDTPDYTGAYKIRAEQDAKAQMGGSIASGVANMVVPGLGTAMQGMSMISNAALKDAKGNYKSKGAEMFSSVLNPTETAGQALSALTGDKTAAADLFSKVPITAGLQALGMKNPFGKTTQERVKEEAMKQEEITKMANINKRYSEATATDAQAALAKRGKYKVKTKQPRLIETEGREPIFSPKKPDGTRDLLYYNPNDPTHEEGGVKAVVMPKAQGGFQNVLANKMAAQPSSTTVARPTKTRPTKEALKIEKELNEALVKDVANKDRKLTNYRKAALKKNAFLKSTQEKRDIINEYNDYKEGISRAFTPLTEEEEKNLTRAGLENFKYQNPEEGPGENLFEIIDPTGISSWDDIRRFNKRRQSPDYEPSALEAIMEYAGAIPGGRIPFQLTGRALKGLGLFGKTKKAVDIGEKVFTPAIGTFNKINRFRKTLPKGSDVLDEAGDYLNAIQIYDDLFGKKAYGAKQLKVKELNDTSLSQNFAGMPAANAANKFIQPMAGIQQVARQIPEERRQEKRNTPRSHKKTVGPVKTVEPPMLYEMKPPPPRSTFNTKNDFKKGGKYIRTYQEGVDGTEANATYKHGKTFKDRMAYQEALRAHDDSLNLYKQSRYFTNLVNKSNLYQPTVENPPVKNVVRTTRSTTSSPTKKFGSPDDRSETFITVAGINPIRKDLHSRKESKYKSFKEYEDAKAANPNQGIEEHEGYEINMYKHPEMAVNYAPDTISPIKVRTPKLKIPKDSIVTKTPRQVVIPNTKTPTKDKEEVVTNKPRGKFIAKEKTFFEELGEKASNFFNKIGSSNRPVNGRRITVFK